MPNTQFLVRRAVSLIADQPRGRVLDYGCGGAELVSACLEAGLDASGCDLYYEGGDLSGRVPERLFRECRVQRMVEGRIPWPDQTFDVVLTNQVFEHVEDLEQALSEIQRVMKHGGSLVALFPDRGVWKEPHCGIPFAHWFPKGSRLTTLWLFLFRCWGFGYFKQGLSRWEWSVDFTQWIAQWTHYRSRTELKALLAGRFGEPRDIAVDFFNQRAAHRPWLLHLPNRVKRFIVSTWAGVALEIPCLQKEAVVQHEAPGLSYKALKIARDIMPV
jgi:SAM-dependent methyltransferase